MLGIAAYGREISNGTVAAHIAESAYDARMQDDHALQGEATLAVTHAHDRATLLPLEPCGLALQDAHWGGGLRDEPAILGAGPKGRLSALVEKSADLQFHWSLRPQGDAEGGWRYVLAMPCSPRKTLQLDLPAGYVPELNHGAVVGRTPSAGGRVRWKLELGGGEQVTLTLKDAVAAPRETQVSARQSSTYELSPRGVELNQQLSLDVRGAPLRALQLALDSGLTLVSARQGNEEIAVSLSPGDAGASKETRVTLDFPTPLAGLGRTIRLSAVAPLELGKLQNLPAIRPLDVTWRQGAATVRLAAPLSLSRLDTSQCVQSSALSGGEVEVQMYAADAKLSVLVERQRESCRVSEGHAVQLDGGEITSSVVCQFEQISGERFSLDAEFTRLWSIDTLVSEPPDAVKDWRVDTTQSGRPGLSVRLARPLAPGDVLRLFLTGRRLESAVGAPQNADELAMLHFRGPGPTRRLLCLRAVAPYQLSLIGDEGVRRLDPRDLASSDRGLFAQLPEGVMFALDPQASRLQVSLERKRPQYDVSVRIEALVNAQTLSESYTIGVTPAAAPISQLLVQFAQPRDAALAWSLTSEPSGAVSAVRLSEQQTVEAGLPSDAEVWRLALQRPHAAPFELVARRSAPLEKRQTVSLASLPEARGQTGQLRIWAPAGVPLEVVNRQLNPTPPAARGPVAARGQEAIFRFDPARDASPGAEGAIEVGVGGAARIDRSRHRLEPAVG